MDYFLLKPFEEGCKLKLVNHDPDILICKMTREGEFPDFTLQPVPMVSDRVKDVLEKYVPFMDFTPCVLEGKDHADFWAPHLKDLEVSEAQYWPDGTVKAVPCFGLLPIIRIPNYKKISFVINLALAESLLRRGYVNLELEKIEMLGGAAI